MAEVGSAFVTVIPSAKGFGRALDSQVGGETKASGGRAGKLFGGALKLGAVAAVGGAAALAGFLGGALSEAREAQKVGALTNAVIKSTGGVANVTAKDVDRLSTSLSNKIGVDDEAIAAGQNMLLTFGNVRNEVGKGNQIFTQATIAASDMAAAFGGDAVSNSKMLGKALNDPTKGVSALTRVGVSFTQQQKDQIKTMQASGDILGAQKIILGEVSKQTAGAAASQASAADKAKVAFGNLQESIGTLLLPVIDRMLNGFAKFAIFLTNNVGPGLAAVNGWIAPLITRAQALFASFANGGAGGPLGAFLTTIRGVGAYLATNLLPIFLRVGQIIATNVVPIVASLARFFVGTLLPAVVKIVTAVGAQLKPVLDALFLVIQTSVLPTVQKLLVKFREYLPTIQKVVVIVLRVVGAVLTLAAAILGRVLPPLIRFAGFLLRNVVAAVVAVIGVVVKIIGRIIAFGSAVIDAGNRVGQFASTVRSKIGDALGFIKDLPGKAKAALGNLGSILYSAGSALIQGLINGIGDKMGAAVQKVRDGLSAIKGLLPGSPIRWGPLKGWNNTGPTGPGGQLIGRLISGIDSRGPALEASMTRLARRVQVGSPHISATVSGGAGGTGSAGGGALVHIDQMITHDPAEAAYRLRVEQRKALALAGTP